MGFNFVVGVALCAVAGIVQTPEGFRFAQSAWILPAVALTFVLGEINGVNWSCVVLNVK